MDALVSAASLSRPSMDRPRSYPSGERPRLSVVIVNYLHWEDTARLVGQLRASAAVRDGTAEIIVVDNHSPGHPLISWLRRIGGVTLRRWKANLGFARAVNEACRLSNGDWTLLLNPDTSVAPGFLDELLARLDLLSDHVGIVGFQLQNDDGSRQHSTGPDPSFVGTLARLLLPRRFRKYDLQHSEHPAQVDWVTGCGLLVRRTCYLDVGGLDDSFFLYYEDADLCRRARLAGWSVWFDPTLALVHHRPLHDRAVPPHLRLITRHALLTYASKYWSSWQVAILAGIVRCEALVRTGLAQLRGQQWHQQIFVELGRLAAEIHQDNPEAARARLLRVIQRLETHRVPTAVDCHSVPQSSRSATAVPGQHPAPCQQSPSAPGR
ncbi:MAG: glycosyltransferase family 2 protein [Gemmataceae bacterium]